MYVKDRLYETVTTAGLNKVSDKELQSVSGCFIKSACLKQVQRTDPLVWRRVGGGVSQVVRQISEAAKHRE